MSKKKGIVILLCLAMIGTFSSCGSSKSSSDSNSSSGDSKTLTIAIQDEIEGTDIQQIGWDNIVHSLIYSPLVSYNDDLTKLSACFAKSYEISKNGLEITFHLYSDSKFSNGDVLNAESVKKSVMRYKKISQYSGDLDSIKEVKVIDDTTVKYILSEPAPFMWASVASVYGGIDDVTNANKVGNDKFNKCAVTNGPYYVEKWKAGSEIILKKNKYFKTSDPNVKNKGIMKFDTVVVKFIPDKFTRVSELQSGDTDIIYDVPASNISDLKSDSNVQLFNYKQAGVCYMRFNVNDSTLSDIRVREAINYGIDRDSLAEALNNVITPIYGFLSDAQVGYSASEEQKLAAKYKYDPDKAKQLLKEAGYTDSDNDGYVDKNGKILTVNYCSPTDRASAKEAAPVIQQQLKNIGIKFNIREYQASYIKQLMREDKFQAAAHNYVWNDADILYSVFTKDSGFTWDDSKVTQLLTKARFESNTEKRVEDYAEVQEAMFSNLPGLPLFSDNYYIAVKKGVSGFHVTNDGRTILNDISK